MGLIKSETQSVFDLTQIHRGDCIRIRRTLESTAKNGFVTEAEEKHITILYCNSQNNANSYLVIDASDVERGAWEIWWTGDFTEISKYPEDQDEGGGE